MWSRSEAQLKRKEFWTAFGRYMSRHRSEWGQKVNWLNYKTGVRHIYFRLHADNRLARVAIELHHPDAGIRELFFEQWQELQALLHNLSGTEWTWDAEHFDEEGRTISRIYVETFPVNIYDPTSWHDIFPFFEKHLIALDEIWSNTREIFRDLAE